MMMRLRKEKEKVSKSVVEIHASRIGKCIRSLAFHIKGAPTGKLDPKKEEVFKEGERLEPVVLYEIEKEGFRIKPGIKISDKFNVRGYMVKVTGTPDFRIFYNNEWIPGEVKTMNSYRFNNLKERFSEWEDFLKYSYSFQLLSYAILSKRDTVMWLVKEKLHGKRFQGKYKVIPVSVSELPSKDEWINRISTALGVLDGEEVLPESFENCSYCLYQEVCETSMGIIKHKEVREEDYKIFEKVRKYFEDIIILEEDLYYLDKKFSKLSKIILNKYEKYVLEDYLKK